MTPSIEGTPQGGPLSPLLSNIVLDELDKEIERRGLRFVRYADDFAIYLKSKKAAERVMESIKRFKERVRGLTHRRSGKSLTQVIYNLNLNLKEWWNCYGLTEGRTIFRSLNGWILRRLRCLL